MDARPGFHEATEGYRSQAIFSVSISFFLSFFFIYFFFLDF